MAVRFVIKQSIERLHDIRRVSHPAAASERQTSLCAQRRLTSPGMKTSAGNADVSSYVHVAGTEYMTPVCRRMSRMHERVLRPLRLLQPTCKIELPGYEL